MINQIKTHSNPDLIEFISDEVLYEGRQSFANIDEAKDFPIVQQLFYLPFVKSVVLEKNSLLLERFAILEWPEVQDEVLEQLQTYLKQGGLVVNPTVANKKIPVTVYAERTPNPTVMKFVANRPLVQEHAEFNNIDEAKNWPFVQELFHLPFVKSVFLDQNYVAIAKYDSFEWEAEVMKVREFVRDYLQEGKTLCTAPKTTPSTATTAQKLNETEAEIVRILEEYVKPAVAADGGNIAFQAYHEENKVVQVLLQGACSGCPSSTFTLKNGIQTMLQEFLPGKVAHVEAINA